MLIETKQMCWLFWIEMANFAPMLLYYLYKQRNYNTTLEIHFS